MVTEGRILVITKQKTNIQMSIMSLCVEVDCVCLLDNWAVTAVCICTLVLTSTNQRQREIFSWPMREHELNSRCSAYDQNKREIVSNPNSVSSHVKCNMDLRYKTARPS